MIGFFIKKSFFDGWDNLIGLVVQNLGYTLFLLGVAGCLGIGDSHTALSIALLVLLAGLFSFYQAGTGFLTYSYSKYERGGFAGFKSGITTSWHHALLYWAIIFLLLMLAFFVMPFYMSYGNTFGLVITVVLFWVFIACFLALMYFFPLHFTMSADRPTKTFKKCFILIADNLGVSLFCALYIVVQAVISFFTAGLVPGFAGIQLTGMVCIKLLMLKYDYLEANPGSERKHIPWEEILYDERECVGHRSFRNMIFPWKD